MFAQFRRSGQSDNVLLVRYVTGDQSSSPRATGRPVCCRCSSKLKRFFVFSGQMHELTVMDKEKEHMSRLKDAVEMKVDTSRLSTVGSTGSPMMSS